MSTQNTSLFSEFDPVSKEDWKGKVNTDLKGVDFEKLVWNNLNGIKIQPFYNSEDTFDVLSNTGENSQELINYRLISVTDVAEAQNQVLRAMNEGINGLLFDIKIQVSPADLLIGVDLNFITVSFILNEDTLEFGGAYIQYASQQVTQKENLKGFLDIQYISNYVTTGQWNSKLLLQLQTLTEAGLSFPNFKTITLSGTSFLDSGSNQVQEVAYTLNALVFIADSLIEKGITATQVFDNLHIQLGIGSEYFIEIGKFRAFQNLFVLVAKEFGVDTPQVDVTAKTSVWTKSVTDAHTNLLRATTEAMSAILGNVDGILIDPYDKEFRETSLFSNRIAANIVTVLIEESYFGKVANPVDGSYYVEEATMKIAERALELFKSIEAEGGFYKAFESGLIQKHIAEIRQEKIKWISQRRLPLVGVNKYPNLMEKVDLDNLSESQNLDSKILMPRRASLEIEAVRKRTELLVEASGKRPVVELISFGNLTMRKARAAFSYDFLGVSGFEVEAEKSFDEVQTAAKTSAESQSEVVVICSSDADYESSAITFVETFRKYNQDKVLILAGNPVAIMDSLIAAGLNGCIHMKSDVVQTISSIQKQVQNTFKSLEV